MITLPGNKPWPTWFTDLMFELRRRHYQQGGTSEGLRDFYEERGIHITPQTRDIEITGFITTHAP